jgi:hypothetical protein
MAGRIDYSISVTPIQTNTIFEGVVQEAIESDIGRTLGGGKSDSVWTGTAPTWSNNDAAHKQSRTSSNTIATVAETDGLWIKHTGFKYDSGLSTTAETTTKVIVSRRVTHTEFNAGSDGSDAGTGNADIQIAKLESGQGIFLPTPGVAATWVLTDDAAGQAVAVEFAEMR